MSKKRLVVALSLLAVLTASCANRYSVVPKEMRARLDERLKESSSYLRTQQFDKYYDLFSDSYIEELKAFNHGTKDEYLEHGKGLTRSVPPFDDCIPRSTAKTANDAYLISGEI